MVPELSLSSEVVQEQDRRRAARLPLVELQMLADQLICDWYRHRQVIDCAMRGVATLEIQMALDKAPDRQGHNPPSQDHLDWARELRGQITSANCSTSSDA